MADAREGTKAIAVGGIQPSMSAIETGAYPLTRPLYLITSAEPPATIQAFLAFALGQDGQRLVARHHVRIR